MTASRCEVSQRSFNIKFINSYYLTKAKGTAVAERIYKESNLVAVLSHSWETVGVEGE